MARFGDSLNSLLNSLENPAADENGGIAPAAFRSYRRHPTNFEHIETDDDYDYDSDPDDIDDDRSQKVFSDILLGLSEPTSSEDEEDEEEEEEDDNEDEVHSWQYTERQPEKRVRFRPVLQDVIHTSNDQDSNSDQDLDDENLVDKPEWFEWQSFQHSQTVLVFFLLGAYMTVLVGGDMLLAIIAIGALVTHLFHEAGATKVASSIEIFCTICSCMVIVYNIAPLVIWKSLWYVILLASAFTYICLTGAWFLIIMKDFCRREPHFTCFVENVLFTVYPVASCILVTWTLSMYLGLQYVPLVLLVTGFLFGQLSMRRRYSSFVKSDWCDDTRKRIVHPVEAASLHVIFVIVPSVTHIIIQTAGFNQTIFSLALVFDFLAWIAGAAFLSTFLPLQTILSTFESLSKLVSPARLVSILVAIVMGTLALHFHGYQSLLLPWWPLIFLAAWTAIGYSLSKSHQNHSIALGVNTVALSVIIIMQMPWALKYDIGDSGWNIQVVYILLLINSLLCSAAVYASRYLPTDVFSLVLLLHSIVFSFLVHQLHQSHLMSTVLAVSVHLLCAFMALRMEYMKKLLWQHGLLSSSVHLSSIVTLGLSYVSMNRALDMTSDSEGWILPSVRSLALFSLSAACVYSMVLQRSAAFNTTKSVLLIAVTGLVCFIFVSSLQLFTMFGVEASATIAVSLGASCVVMSVPTLKLALCHRCGPSWMIPAGPVLSIIGLSLVLLQPCLTLQQFNVVKLLALQAVLSGCVLVSLMYKLKSFTPVMILCLVTGLPFGVILFLVVYEATIPKTGFYMLAYGLMCSLVIAMCVTALKQTAKTEYRLYMMSVSAELLALVSIVVDMVSCGLVTSANTPGYVGGVVCLVTVAALIKSQSLTQLPQITGISTETKHLPTVGNLATVFSFFLLCLVSPVHVLPPELWIVASSGVFFLLRREDVDAMPASPHRHVTPTISTVSCLLLFSIIFHSPLWQPHRYFSATLCAVLEMSATILTAPVILTLWIVLFFGDFHDFGVFTRRAQALSVLYFTPFFLCFVFMPLSTTYHSWAYAVLGLSGGTWLWKTHIPLTLL